MSDYGSGYSYDYRDRLVYCSGNGIARYTYYVDGLRKSKSANNKTTYFIWLDGNMVYEFTGTESNTYTYGHRLLFSEEYKYILNAHGDVEVLIESDNTFVHRYRYDAFGNELNPSASDTNPFRYCAEYYDLETEQIYLRNRYYQPVTGRFTQLDPIRDGLNWYAYCYNNPVTYVDITGLVSVKSVTRLISRNIIANPFFVDKTQSGEWKDLFELAGFNYNKKTGTYHAHPDAWQQIGGYNYVYDIVFDYATNMESVQFEFVYNDEKFIIWAWKGDYLNLGAGSEMGIYKNLTINGKETDQWVVDRNYSLYMSATLVGEDGYNIIYQYNPSEKQWWITGFNPNYQNVTPEQLTAYFSIKFDNEDMYKQFCKTIDDRNGLWWFNDSEQTAGFCF